MGLIEQGRAWAPLIASGYECPAAGQTIIEMADALTKLRSYAVHERSCSRWIAMGDPCGCGLADLLKEIGDDR